MEGLVLDRLRSFFVSRTEILEALKLQSLSARDIEGAFKRSADQAAQWLVKAPRETAELVRAIVRKVTIGPKQISLSICQTNLAESLGLPVPSDGCQKPIVLDIAAELKRCGKGKRLVIHNGMRFEIHPGLIQLLHKAFRARRTLLEDSDASRQPLGLGAKRLIGLSKHLPYDWQAQRAYLGFDRG